MSSWPAGDGTDNRNRIQDGARRMIDHPDKHLSMNGHSGSDKTEHLIATMVANLENLPAGMTIGDGPW